MWVRRMPLLAVSLAASLIAAIALASSFSAQEPAAPTAYEQLPLQNPPTQVPAEYEGWISDSIETNDSETSVGLMRAVSDRDRFGITEIYPTAASGKEWTANWDNEHQRTLQEEVDPDDLWFDTSHGEGTYIIDGHGTMVASGDYVRMYVHDPANKREWSENLEITLYVTRVSETKVVDYSGLQIFARTNHGTVGDEDKNLCDDRGYGALALLDGTWTFEKETAHHLDNGYADLEGAQPWKSLPKDVQVGVKYVLRNMDSDSKVKLELYRDLAGGAQGGEWEKLYEFIDDGTNFGIANGKCRQGVDPTLQLIHSYIDSSSETEKPILSVYVRHEFGIMKYSAFTIREIDPLP